MKKIDLDFRLKYLDDMIEKVDRRLHKLESPARFSVGDWAKHKSGATDGKWIVVIIVRVWFDEDEIAWNYDIWNEPLKFFITFSDSTFYDKDHYKLIPHDPDSIT